MPLVSKAFQAASEWCWSDLELDALRLGPAAPAPGAAAAFWRGLAAWSARRAAGIRTLKLLNVRHLLRELDEEERLAALAGLWTALASDAGGPALQALELGRSSVALAPGTLAAAACLTSLRELTLHSAGPLDFAEVDAIAARMGQLEQLTLCLLRQRGVHSSFQGPFPAGLARLKRLRRLHLEAPYSGFNAPHCALPEAVGDWGGQVGFILWGRCGWRSAVCSSQLAGDRALLQPLHYSQCRNGVLLKPNPTQMRELHLINLGLEALPPSISRLTALRELWYVDGLSADG